MLFSPSPPTFLKLPGPKFTAGKGAAEGKGKGREGGGCRESGGTFSSGCFLWFRVWVNVSKPQGLAGPSRQTLEGKRGICVWLTTEKEEAIFNQSNGHHRACQNCENTERNVPSASQEEWPSCHADSTPPPPWKTLVFISRYSIGRNLASTDEGTANRAQPGPKPPSLFFDEASAAVKTGQGGD